MKETIHVAEDDASDRQHPLGPDRAAPRSPAAHCAARVAVRWPPLIRRLRHDPRGSAAPKPEAPARATAIQARSASEGNGDTGSHAPLRPQTMKMVAASGIIAGGRSASRRRAGLETESAWRRRPW